VHPDREQRVHHRKRMAAQPQLVSSIESLIAQGGLRAVFQPIVELETGRTIGHEALARGPRGSSLENPTQLFAAAGAEGVYTKLDRACRGIALNRALAAGLGPSDLLFLNAEPAGLGPEGVLDPIEDDDFRRVSVVVELTERALASRPSEVLAVVRWLRERNCRIALDDVGVDRRSLALMPFLAPDVIKLDARLVQDGLPPLDAARLLNTVGAEAERSGSIILAEGIETPEQLRRARAIGATLGQGWLFGRPTESPSAPPRRAPAPIPSRSAAPSPGDTPFERIAPARGVRRVDKRLLLALSHQLEEEALGLRGNAVVLASFQDACFFSRQTRARYERLARNAGLVGALGTELPPRPATDIRGAALAPDDPLREEWDVIVVGPHFSGAFAARDLGDRGPDLERRYDFAVTYDRALVSEAAHTLLGRIVASA
jgi:EAL domain-containing protein (putative c-di-GMP-specific phosphodiesterase class I)